jgi:hypothetical protein
VHRRNLEAFAAGLAGHFVVDTNQVVAQLGKLGAIAFIGARRQTVLLRPAYPTHGVFVRSPAAWAAQSFVAVFVAVGKEGAFV